MAGADAEGMHTTTRQRGALTSVVLSVALLGGACGGSGPRATRLPPGADSPVVETSTTAVAASGAPAAASGSGPAPRETPGGAAAALNTANFDLDLTQLEADLRRLDEDLSNSETTTEGAVE